MAINFLSGVHINLVFLNQNYLVEGETLGALRRIEGVRAVALSVVSHPSDDQALRVTELLDEQNCSVLFTVNEWGLDSSGIIARYLDSKKILHINWCVDDPFFEEIMQQKKFRPSPLRFDFVSDKGYVGPMLQRGYGASFLPLATDTSIYYPSPANEPPGHDIVFVGNSYTELIDTFLELTGNFLESMTPFLAGLIARYMADYRYDIERDIELKIRSTKLPDDLPEARAIFIAKHFAGYLHRKQTILALVRKYPGFTVVGDDHWLKNVAPEQFARARYGQGLRELYQKSRIVIDINRVVIRNGFTQRVFDAPLCGCLVLTSAKPVVNEYFCTGGSRRELGVFRNMDELTGLIDYFLAHESDRLETSSRARSKIVAAHTYDHRVAAIFRSISESLAGS